MAVRFPACFLSKRDENLRSNLMDNSVSHFTSLASFLMVCFVVLQEVVIQLLKDAMLKHPDSPGFLIDGFPREISQGVQFEEEVSHWTGRVYNLNLGTHI